MEKKNVAVQGVLRNTMSYVPVIHGHFYLRLSVSTGTYGAGLLQPVSVSGTRKVLTMYLVISQRLYVIPHVRMVVSPFGA